MDTNRGHVMIFGVFFRLISKVLLFRADEFNC